MKCNWVKKSIFYFGSDVNYGKFCCGLVYAVWYNFCLKCTWEIKTMLLSFLDNIINFPIDGEVCFC